MELFSIFENIENWSKNQIPVIFEFWGFGHNSMLHIFEIVFLMRIFWRTKQYIKYFRFFVIFKIKKIQSIIILSYR